MVKLFQPHSIRFTLATLFTLAVAGGAACGGDDDNPTPVEPKADSGVDSSPGTDSGVDSGPPDPGDQTFDKDQKFANLGTCALESGKTIENCQIGYRTFGTLSTDGSNVVLWPTWFTGNTSQLVDLVPSGGANTGVFIDTSKYFVVLVDALGDGVSSSPSNSKTQRRLDFPVFNIRDMVNTQYRLLTEGLATGGKKINHITAVAGISMGGMQAIQWSVSYPDFMDKIVAIVGSPRLTSQDKLLWRADLLALQNDPLFLGGNYTGKPVFQATIDILNLVLTTPDNQVANADAENDFDSWITTTEKAFSGFDGTDWHRQLEAMMAHDVNKGGSLADAAKKVKAKSLYMVSKYDHVVNPKYTKEFAADIQANSGNDAATVIESDSLCGHIAAQSKKLGPTGNPCGIAEEAGVTVDEFLAAP